MNFKATWLSLGTILFGFSFRRRSHYIMGLGETLTQIDPGYSLTIWLGIVNLTWETSEKYTFTEGLDVL